MGARVLLVEDNADVALGLQRSLELEGHEVSVATDGEEGLRRVSEDRPDLVVLDLMLPKLDGFGVLRAMREGGMDMPVLILSAKGEEIDKVQGFRLGADNYAVKPVGVLELIARVDALLRRRAPGGGAGSAGRYRFGDVTVDIASRDVRRGDHALELSPKEFDLLVRLLRAGGAVVGRETLLREVWGHKRAVATRTVDAHVALLRRKLEADSANPRYLLTVRKAGYRIADAREDER